MGDMRYERVEMIAAAHDAWEAMSPELRSTLRDQALSALTTSGVAVNPDGCNGFVGGMAFAEQLIVRGAGEDLLGVTAVAMIAVGQGWPA